MKSTAHFFSGTKAEEFKMIFFLLLLVSQIPVTTACEAEEYDYGGICCSLCSPGTRVKKHCTLMKGTLCSSCAAGEYMEYPTSLEHCLKCKACDHELGFQIKKPCTYTHNTVCEPREGYYCIQNCLAVVKHTPCRPGQGVKEKGTNLKDTVCENCPYGSFSSISSSTEECKNWTVCETLKLTQIKPGDATADVKCEGKSSQTVIASIIGGSVGLVAILASFLLWKYKSRAYGESGL
ncbi:tumor necrosis factor receptor superfamily member 5-like isoform X2 [Hypanus sabinus]|uniref:tumor necrosis factor receptor superfamily member 5-like isoform X2 n=1 Tax=Hypanus sabinus TaxID=79690 RepID=UPI0028C47755|nr:tumor necrosis factor receptor superfamily member 5-like isoform X2 [Hypanus sabinus]